MREVLAYSAQNASLPMTTLALAEERVPSGAGSAVAGGGSKVLAKVEMARPELAKPEQQGGGSVCATFGLSTSGCEARRNTPSEGVLLHVRLPESRDARPERRAAERRCNLAAQ